jgi:hypothetical protein
MEKLSMDKIILTSQVARNFLIIEVLQHRTTVNENYYERESKCKQTHLEGIIPL